MTFEGRGEHGRIFRRVILSRSAGLRCGLYGDVLDVVNERREERERGFCRFGGKIRGNVDSSHLGRVIMRHGRFLRSVLLIRSLDVPAPRCLRARAESPTRERVFGG